MKRVFIIIACLSILVGSLPYHTDIPGTRGEHSEEISITSRKIIDVPPGESRCLFYDSNTSEVAQISLPDVCAGLPETVSEAIMKVPLWLRRDLSNKFGELSEVKLS
ncbi:MAG: hypothetical protein KAU14_02130, partial [Thermoplasmata archaeon]|nr:hypothetical protein [Thermoplasmata archaeon]